MDLQEWLYTVDEFREFINRVEFEYKRIELREEIVVEGMPSRVGGRNKMPSARLHDGSLSL